MSGWLNSLFFGAPAQPAYTGMLSADGPAEAMGGQQAFGATPAQPARMGLLDPNNAGAAGLFTGLQNLGAQLVAAGRPGGGGWAQGLATGGAAFSQGMQQGTQQARARMRDNALSEASSDRPDDQLSDQGRAARAAFAGLPPNARRALSLLPPEQQAEALARLVTQRPNPRENFIETNGRIFDVSSGTPREVARADRLRTPEELAQEIQIRREGAPRVSVQLPPMENRFANETGASLAGEATEITAAGRRAADTIRTIERFERGLGNFDTGAAANARLTVGQIAQQLGIPDNALPAGLRRDAVASGEDMRAITSQMLAGMVGPGGFPAQNFSNADREMLERSLPNIANTPNGNRLLIAGVRAAAERNVEIAREWRSWQMRNGNNAESFMRFQSERLPLITERNVVTEAVRAAGGMPQPPGGVPIPGAGGATAVPPQPMGTGGLPRVSSIEEARRLPPGTRFVGPDGLTRTVPR